MICLCEEIKRHLPRTVDLDVFGAKKRQDKLLSQLTKPAMLLDVQKIVFAPLVTVQLGFCKKKNNWLFINQSRRLELAVQG